MKPDFHTHKGTFLLYPSRKDVWREDAKPIAEAIMNLATVISGYERVILGVLPELIVPEELEKHKNIDVRTMLYDDIWVRDTGAVPCETELKKFGFNAWGGEDGLYGDWTLDETVPEQMSRILGMKLDSVPLVLEGGNLLTNGNGTLVAIRSSICNKNRNPYLSIQEIERILKKSLKIRKVIWLEQGLMYDETGGHIDNICAFADEHTILLAWTDELTHPQYEIVRDAYTVLSNERGANGEVFDIIKIPLPMPFQRTEEQCVGLEQLQGSKERLPGEWIQPSYINYIFVNGAVIIPIFDDLVDDAVKAVFKEVFYDREVITFPSREIVLGGGGLHCITKNY